MSDVMRLFLMLCIAGAIMLLFRALPFVLFGKREIPGSILYLGRVLPMAVMCILVLYCIKDISFSSAGGFVPYTVSLAVVAGVHIWKRSTALSILAGTACYMLLIRIL